MLRQSSCEVDDLYHKKIFIGPLINHYERFSLALGANDVSAIKDATTYV